LSHNKGMGAIKSNQADTISLPYPGSTKNTTLQIQAVRSLKRRILAIPLLITGDILAFLFSILVAYSIRAWLLPAIVSVFPQINIAHIVGLWWIPLLGCILFTYEKLYTKRLPFWQEAGQVVKSSTLAFLVAACVVFLAKLGDATSRSLVMLAWIVSLFVLPLMRYFWKRLLVLVRVWEKQVIVVGAGETGKLIINALNRESTIGYKPVGFLDDDNVKQLHPPKTPSGHEIPVLGGFKDAEIILENSCVQDVIIVAPGLEGQKLVQLINRLQRKASNIMVVPDLFGMAMEGIDVQYLFDERTLVLGVKNNLNDKFNVFTKKFFDLLAGLAIFVMISPFMLLIAVLIKLDSKGPLIFAHKRIGKNGEEFYCYKFRTMVSDAKEVLEELLEKDPKAREEWYQDFKLKNDPRITRVGNFLRKTSLDELPQIFNVIKGDMSLVGPRPIVKDEIIKYGSKIDYYYQVLPGVTGLWQVSGRSDVDYETRVQFDTWYVRNWSLWLDITLLMRTVAVVLTRKGAY